MVFAVTGLIMSSSFFIKRQRLVAVVKTATSFLLQHVMQLFFRILSRNCIVRRRRFLQIWKLFSTTPKLQRSLVERYYRNGTIKQAWECVRHDTERIPMLIHI